MTQHNVWNGGTGTGDEIEFIGPSMALSPRRSNKPRKQIAEDSNRLRGKVDAYFESRGFGFILPEAPDAPQVFVHIGAIPEGTELRRGTSVTYELARNIRSGRTSAVNVKVERG